MRIKTSVFLLVLVLALTCLPCFAEAETVEQQTLTLGSYEFSVPTEWDIEKNDYGGYFIYSNYPVPSNGAYIYTAFLASELNEAADSISADIYMENFLNGYFSNENMEQMGDLSADIFTAEALCIRCYKGCYSEYPMYACFWIYTDGYYVFSYMNAANDDAYRLEEFTSIVQSISLCKSDVQAEDVSTTFDNMTGQEPRNYVNIDADYKEYARNPDAHTGDFIEFTGKVIQVIESDYFSKYRIAVGDDYDSVFYVRYKRAEGESRILDDDQVTVYGTCTGVITYESTLGGNITIPSCTADKIELYEALDLTISGDQSQSDSDEFPVVGYIYDTSYCNYLYLVITNNSGRNASLNINVRFFDKDGGIVGVSNNTGCAFANGTQMLFRFTNDIAFSSYEFDITAKDETRYAAVTEDLQTEVTVVENKAILSVTNNGSITAEYVEYDMLFMKDGQIVSTGRGFATDSDYEIKPGKTQYVESKSSEEFDQVLVYIKGRGDK